MLVCGCAAIVKMAMPMVFLYWVHVSVPSPNCRRSHRKPFRRFVRLENIRARR
jgi:hypothetical protein